jgi:hypothetical protein
LQHDKKRARGLTVEKIGTLLTADNLGDLTLSVTRALAGAFGADLDEDVEGNEEGAEANAEAPNA